MNLSFAGTWLTFQVTFTELFIAATAFASIARKRGYRSAVLGAIIGALIVVAVAIGLRAGAEQIPIRVLDWISALLLVGFGLYVYYEFFDGLKKNEAGEDRLPPAATAALPLNWAGVSLSSWAIMVEGFEITIVWLAVSLKVGAPSATMGVVAGLLVIGLLAAGLGKSGIFGFVPAALLDFLAATAITGYGIYFLIEATR